MKSFLCFFAQTLEGFLLENDQVVFIRDFKDRSFQDVLESISIVRKGLKNSNDPELERELIEPRHSVIVENQSNDNFDFNECFDVFLRFSVHYQWSFREHKKFMENVKTAVLSTER